MRFDKFKTDFSMSEFSEAFRLFQFQVDGESSWEKFDFQRLISSLLFLNST